MAKFMVKREMFPQNIFKSIPGLRDAFCMNLSQGAMRILAAFIIFYSTVIPTTGQEIVYKSAFAKSRNSFIVPFREVASNAHVERAVAADYCIPTYNIGTSGGDYISLVKLGDINNSSGASSSPYYTYYNAMSTSLRQGYDYTITLSAGTYGLSNNISVWIDYNQDGVFSSAEKLGNVTPGAKPELASISFSVPCDAIVGITRMRVREVYNTSNMDACAKYSYGETEDYNINILPSTLNLNLSATTNCLGSPSGTGTITASGNGGNPPYTYRLNSGNYQSSGLFTGLGVATYTVTVKDVGGCTISQTIAVTNPPTSGDDQNMAGTNSWVGHIYDGINFNNYVGNYTEPEFFDQGFGGATNCFQFTSAGQTHSIYTETYSVRYRMNSTRLGLWVVDLGSDDGGRLYIDNALIYNNFTDQSYSLRPRVLISLTGNSNLVYEFYENSGENRVVFQNAVKILDNILANNLTQSLCIGGSGFSINGDVLGSLPAGISLSGTGYQWVYSTVPGGTQIAIAGATGAAFTPNTAVAPFSSPGTYYVYRNVKLSSINNISPNPYIATNTSNAAVIKVSRPQSANFSYTGSPYCQNASNPSPTFSGGGVAGFFSSTPGLVFTSTATGQINLAASTPGTYTVTNTLAASGGCPAVVATSTITISPVLPVSVSISASANPICTGSSVTFTATPVNGGTTPKYQWKLNGSNVGTNSPTYTINSPINGQSITCVLTSNAPCASGSPATSNAIVMSVGQEIGNNTLNLSSGVYGTVCGIADENATVLMNAPTGSVFVHVAFASYGTPNGSCNAFTYGACNSTSSFPVTETYLLGNNSSAIPATNGVFGDPCVGTLKRLYVQAVYAQPICVGTSPGQITGTLPTGGTGTFTYLWESSTTSATTGFAAASGVNNQQNYTPGNLNQTTWFRRTVYSGCESTSRVIIINVTPAITNNTISASQTICAGETPATLNGSTPAGGTGSYTYLWEKSTTNASTGFSACSGTNNGINYPPTALTQTTWFRRTVISGGCTAISATVQITVNPMAPQPGPILGNSPVCEGSTEVYTVPAVSGVTFNWTFPGDWEVLSGSSTNSVTIIVGTMSGVISVYTLNSCGNSSATTKNVTAKVRDALELGPDPIVCPNTTISAITYTITGGSPTSLTLDFDDAANAAGFSDMNNWTLSGGIITINIPWGIPVGIYNGSLTVTHYGGCPSEVYPVSVTIEDDEAPVIEDCPEDFSIYVDGSCNAANAYWTPPTAVDNCGIKSFQPDKYPGVYLNVANSPHTITYTATDFADNVTLCTFTVTVVRDLSTPVATAATNTNMNSFTANWEEVPFAQTYFIDVSTSAAFADLLPEYNNKNIGNVLNTNISGLMPGNTYYYRVRAYTNCSTSPNSNVISVVTVLPVDPVEVNATIGLAYQMYGNLKLAFDNINNGTHKGAIIVKLHRSTVETATATLNESGSGNANYNSVLIYPTSPGLSITGNLNNPLISLNGADNVTFDGRVYASGAGEYLTIVNNSFSTVSNTSTLRFINSAEDNTVQYCNIKGATLRTSSGIIFFSTSSIGAGNRNNSISNCNISGINDNYRPINVIYSTGTVSRENSANTISNNNIFNHFRSASSSYGINLAGNSTVWTIRGNSFYETTNSLSATGNYIYAPIYISTTAGNGFQIEDNYIGGSAPQCGGGTFNSLSAGTPRFYGIYMNVGVLAASSVQNNVVANWSYSSKNATPWYGIYVVGGAANIGTVTGNTIGSSTGNDNITITNSTVNASTYAIAVNGTGTIAVSNNKIGGITTAGSATFTHSLYGIYSTGAADRIITNNSIGSQTTALSFQASSPSTNVTTQNVRAIWNAASGNIQISGNTIANVHNAYARTVSNSGQTIGILSTAGTCNITNNIIRDITTTSLSTGTSVSAVSLAGIALSSNLSGQTISGNTIYNLLNDGATDAKVQVLGIYTGTSKTAGDNTVSGNFIHSLRLNSLNNSASAVISGIQVAYTASGTEEVTTLFANNIIALGTDVANPCIIYGIYEAGYFSGISNSYNHFYFNSVYIGGNSTGNTLTYAFYNNNQGSNTQLDIRNNIFYNGRTSAGSNIHFAIRLKGIAGVTIDYNDYYVSGNGGTVGRMSTTNLSTLADWQNSTGQDAGSQNLDPLFVNAGGTASANYFPNQSTLIGVGGTGILVDYNGAARSIPTMGAFERLMLTRLWKGTISTDFATAGNWTDGIVPAPGENIEFDPIPLRHCILDGTRTVGNITNAQPTYRLITSGQNLIINGKLFFTNGAQIDAGAASSTLTFSGSVIQTIPAEAMLNNEVFNLVINNPANVVLQGTLNIKGTFSSVSGKLDVTTNGATLGFSGSAAQNMDAFSLLNKEVFNLNLNNDAGLVLTGGLTINGNLHLVSGTFSAGDNNLVFQNGNTPISRENGKLNILPTTNLIFGTAGNAGGNAFALPNDVFSNNPSLNNFTINRTNPLTLNNQMLSVHSILLVTKGVLYTNNNLTLLSTANQTALIDGSGTGQVNGNVIMQRYLPNGFGYKYLSSPMQDATVAQLGDNMDLNAAFPTFYKYDEDKTSTGWTTYINPTSPLLPLLGYCVNFGTNPAPVMADITGKVNNGPIGPLFLFNHNRQFTQGFNLMGNPYPSPIDWMLAAGWSKTNIDNAIYYFDAGNLDQYTGTYSSYINGISSDGVASNIIPSMQGFFVHVSDGAYPVSGSLQVNNQARVNNLSPTFHKNEERDSRPLLRLNAKFEGEQSIEDYLAIYFDPNATTSFEMEMDALKIFNTDEAVPSLFAISADERRLSIGAYPNPVGNLEIPLGLKTEKPGHISLGLDIQENPLNGYQIFLKDKLTGTIQNLSQNPVYSLPVANGLMQDRLVLIFSDSDIAQNAIGTDSFTAYQESGTLYFLSKINDQCMLIQLSNMAGQLLMRESLNGGGTHKIGNAFTPGVYLLTVYTDAGTVSRKIYLQ